jgi:hypothetical protein
LISVAFKKFSECFWSKNIRKLVKNYEFFTFLQNRQKVEKQHIYTKNDDAEFEKKVFLQIELDLTIKKLILC